MVMKSRYRAEASFICQDGLSKYLATKHDKRIALGIATGSLTGLLSTGALFLYQHFTGKYSEPFIIMLPLLIGTISGAGYGVISSDRNDASDTADFNAVCDSLEAEDEEDEEEESDGED